MTNQKTHPSSLLQSHIPGTPFKGILLIDKPEGITSFRIVSILRKVLNVQKIGHAGTLDPFATGLMIMLVGKDFTRQSDQFMNHDKQYVARLHLGKATDTYDKEGVVTDEASKIPTLEEIHSTILDFQGSISQIPPMFSAKKINGFKLYDLARKGIEVERPAQTVQVSIQFVAYNYPYLDLKIDCSKGTYVRTLAHDIGLALKTYAHLQALRRTRIGSFHIADAIQLDSLREQIKII